MKRSQRSNTAKWRLLPPRLSFYVMSAIALLVGTSRLAVAQSVVDVRELPQLSDWPAAAGNAETLLRSPTPVPSTSANASADSAPATFTVAPVTELADLGAPRSPEPSPTNAPAELTLTVADDAAFGRAELPDLGQATPLASTRAMTRDLGDRGSFTGDRELNLADGLVETTPVIPTVLPRFQQRSQVGGYGIDLFPVGSPQAVANGRSTLRLDGTLIVPSDEFMPDEVVVTLTASAGEFVGADADLDRPGFQTIARQGQFTATLQSTLDPQQVRVRAAVDQRELSGDRRLPEDENFGADPVGYASATSVAQELETFTQVQFVTELRPALLAGTVNLRIGEAGTNYWGSFRDFLDPEELDNGTEVDVDAAVFAIGSVGQWQYTAAFNSERTLNETCDQGSRLFRADQSCENQYPVYGDSSTVDALTPSQDSFYVRFQRDALTLGAEPDYFMWGDYGTAELARASQLFTATSRQLHGFKGNYSLGNLQLTALYANNVDGFQRDTIPPDGTSGYYFVSRRLLLPGSEEVYLETEELNRPGTVVSRERLYRGPDYEIDYDRGAVLFRRPIQATEFDAFGNSLVRRIVVTYQFEGENSSVTDLIAGRAQYNFSYGFEAPSWVAISYLNEDQSDRDFQLYGADFLVSIGQVGQIIGEYARSIHSSPFLGDIESEAYRLEANAGFGDRVNLRAYYRSVDENFANNATLSFTPGQTRLGGAIAAAVTDTTRVSVQYDFEENFGVAPLVRTSLEELLIPGLLSPPGSPVDNTLTTLQVGLQQEIGAATFNVDFVDRSRRDRREDSLLDNDSSQLVSRLTVPLAERLSFQALNATSLSNQEDPLYPDRTALGLNWAASPGVNIRLTQQFLYGAAYNDTSITSLDTIVTQELGEDTTLTNRYSILGGANGITTQSALGLRHRWVLAPGLRVNFGYERISGDIFADTAAGQQYAQPYAVGQAAAAIGAQAADSYSVGIEYTDNPDFRANARFEQRNSTAGNNTVWSAGAAGRISPALTVLARYQQSNFANQVITGLLGDTSSLRVGLAYRDPYDDRFNGLLRYEYRTNPDTTPDSILAGSGRGSEDHTFAFEGIYAPTWRWEFYGKYALRQSTAFLSEDLSVGNSIHFAQGRVAYRLGYQWDVAGDLRWISQSGTGFTEVGGALEVGYYPTADLRVGLGYNFGRVTDEYTDDRSDGGLYLTVNFKVNELLRTFGFSDTAPPQQQESIVEESILSQATESTPAAHSIAGVADRDTGLKEQKIASAGE